MTKIADKKWNVAEFIFVVIFGLQPGDKAAMLGVNTIDFFLEEFT